MIEIHTDGAYNPVLERGGWAAVIITDGQKHTVSGSVEKSTSNRMEITAALEGIRRTPENAIITVHTDSQYLVNCMSRGWKKRANQDLWEQMAEAVRRRQVRWQWLERADNNPHHQEAHQVATKLSGRVKSAEEKQELTHLDASGKPHMVDIGQKPDTQREAVAGCTVRMQPATMKLLMEGKMPKGNVLTVAQLAGIMAAKQTPNLIPLCHPLLISDVAVDVIPNDKNNSIEITATVKSQGKTGVEMEALTAAAVAALTVYDMCKAVERGITIESLRLLHKSGGKSGTINLE